LGGGIGRIFKLGLQPVNVTAQFYGNAVHPTNGSPWSMRLQIAFLFPKPTSNERETKGVGAREVIVWRQVLRQFERGIH
jgi:hypothetical protein